MSAIFHFQVLVINHWIDKSLTTDSERFNKEKREELAMKWATGPMRELFRQVHNLRLNALKEEKKIDSKAADFEIENNDKIMKEVDAWLADIEALQK